MLRGRPISEEREDPSSYGLVLAQEERKKEAQKKRRKQVEEWVFEETLYYDNQNRSWLQVYVVHGGEQTITRMGGFFANLSLVALLTGGVSIAIGSHDSLKKDDFENTSDYSVMLTQLTGLLSFCLSTVCVLDSVMIDNTLRQVATDNTLLRFLSEQASFLGAPQRLLVGAVVCNYIQLVGLVWEIYRLPAMVLVTLFMTTACGMTSLMFYIRLVRWVDGEDFNANVFSGPPVSTLKISDLGSCCSAGCSLPCVRTTGSTHLTC